MRSIQNCFASRVRWIGRYCLVSSLVFYQFWKGKTSMVKDWYVIWIGCCAIVNSALLTSRLNHSRQIQQPFPFPRKKSGRWIEHNTAETCPSYADALSTWWYFFLFSIQWKLLAFSIGTNLLRCTQHTSRDYRRIIRRIACFVEINALAYCGTLRDIGKCNFIIGRVG